MEMIKVIESSLEENQQLNEGLKINFLELVTVFHKQFPEVNLETFNEKIKSLTIERGSKYITKKAMDYNIKNNILSINEEELANVDAKHELMIIVLQMITSKDGYYGFNKNNEFEALSAGVTEIIADFLVGNECE